MNLSPDRTEPCSEPENDNTQAHTIGDMRAYKAQMAEQARASDQVKTQLESEVAAQKARLRLLGEEKANLHHSYAEKESTISELGKRLQQADSESSKLRGQLDDLARSKASLENEVLEKHGKQSENMVALANELQALKDLKLQSERNIAMYEAQIEEKNLTERDYQARELEAKEQNEDQEEEITRLEACLARYESYFKNQNPIETLMNQLKDDPFFPGHSSRTSSQDLKDLCDKNQVLCSKLKAAEETLVLKREELANASGELEALQFKYTRAEDWAKTEDDRMAKMLEDAREGWQAQAEAEKKRLIAIARDESLAQAEATLQDRLVNAREQWVAQAREAHQVEMVKAGAENMIQFKVVAEALHAGELVKAREKWTAMIKAEAEVIFASRLSKERQEWTTKVHAEAVAANQQILSSQELEIQNLGAANNASQAKIGELLQENNQLHARVDAQLQDNKDANGEVTALQQRLRMAEAQHEQMETNLAIAQQSMDYEQKTNHRVPINQPNADVLKLLQEAEVFRPARLMPQDIRLCTFMRIGNELHTKSSRFDAQSVLQVVRHLKLCSDSNRWQYSLTLASKRIPASMCKNEQSLAQAWKEDTRLVRWLRDDNALYEAWLKDNRPSGLSNRPAEIPLRRRGPHDKWKKTKKRLG